MYQRILADPLLFPQDMPHDAMTLITGLLQRDPTKRLGANGAEEIKRHPFFSKHIDWNRCVSMSIERGMGLLARRLQYPVQRRDEEGRSLTRMLRHFNFWC